MDKMIFATLENYKGLPADVVEKMRRKMYIPGMAFHVKKLEPTADGSYKVWFDIEGLGEEAVFAVNAENVKLYKEYEDMDYKRFNPLDDPDFQFEKEKEEN